MKNEHSEFKKLKIVLKIVLEIISKINKINQTATLNKLKQTCEFINKQKIANNIKSEFVGLCFKRLNGGL